MRQSLKLGSSKTDLSDDVIKPNMESHVVCRTLLESEPGEPYGDKQAMNRIQIEK